MVDGGQPGARQAGMPGTHAPRIRINLLNGLERTPPARPPGKGFEKRELQEKPTTPAMRGIREKWGMFHKVLIFDANLTSITGPTSDGETQKIRLPVMPASRATEMDRESVRELSLQMKSILGTSYKLALRTLLGLAGELKKRKCSAILVESKAQYEITFHTAIGRIHILSTKADSEHSSKLIVEGDGAFSGINLEKFLDFGKVKLHRL